MSWSQRLLGICLAHVALTVSATAGEVISHPLPAAQARAVDQAVQATMDEQKLVGVAIGILQQGRIVYLKGYGMADREKHVAVTTGSVFNWASNSKPLAAVLAMQLVEQKKLDLDADVRRYVPEFPDKCSTITTRHLLCHQSGIPHYRNGTVIPTCRHYDEPCPFTKPVLALDTFNKSPLLYVPGEQESYSSYAYILLSAVIERAGNEPFLDQLQSRISNPLKLTSLSPDTGCERPELVTGYAQTGDVIAPGLDEAQYWKHGAGAYQSTVEDFARWAEALLNRRLVSEQTETAMWTIQPLRNGQATSRGLGFGIENEDQGLRVSHNGKQPEVATRLVLYPQAKHGVVVMSNSGYADASKIAAAVYSGLKAP